MCVFNILRNTIIMYLYGLVLLFPIIPGCQAATNYAATEKSKILLSWNVANSFCRSYGGSLLDLVSSVKIDPTLDVLFWTADTLKRIRRGYYCRKADRRTLCGFTQLYENNTQSTVLFGDCYSIRSYVCPGYNGWGIVVHNGAYNVATHCTVHLTNEEIMQLPPGYYWYGKPVEYCQLNANDPPTSVTYYDHVCSVYGRDIGHVYTNCLSRHYAVCLLEPSTLETTGSTRHLTSYKQTEQSANDRTTLIPKQSTPKKTTRSTLLRITQPATGKQQPDSEHTTVQHVSTIEALGTEHSNYAAEISTNTGVKIGVPVAVSLVFICGVILAIVFIRRRQRKNNLPNDDSTLNVRRSRMSGNDYHNQSFEYSGTDRRNIAGNDLYNVCEDSRNNQTLNENDEYCYVKTPEEPELHIYDHTSQGNEQYDTITPKIQTDIQSDSVYNHLADVEKEDVYDSTIPGKLSRIQESDDVYNRLQVGSSMESSQYENMAMKVKNRNV